MIKFSRSVSRDTKRCASVLRSWVVIDGQEHSFQMLVEDEKLTHDNAGEVWEETYKFLEDKLRLSLAIQGYEVE